MIDLLYAYLTYYVLAAIGITFGYHRYFAHCDYKVTPIAEVFLLFCGLLCGGRSALSWAGVHRMHHAYADTEKDPHSPKYLAWWKVIFSVWWIKKIPRKFVKDLNRNPRVMFFHRYGLIILIVSYVTLYFINPNIILYLLAALILPWFFYGALNYLGHNDNGPINRWWINIFAPFEGNHENHHMEKQKRITSI